MANKGARVSKFASFPVYLTAVEVLISPQLQDKIVEWPGNKATRVVRPIETPDWVQKIGNER